jgi:hypothetical protein
MAAHAQPRGHAQPPSEWTTYPFGGGDGTGSDGREWTSRSFPVGGTTVTIITNPDGHEHGCESYMLGSDTITLTSVRP